MTRYGSNPLGVGYTVCDVVDGRSSAPPFVPYTPGASGLRASYVLQMLALCCCPGFCSPGADAQVLPLDGIKDSQRLCFIMDAHKRSFFHSAAPKENFQQQRTILKESGVGSLFLGPLTYNSNIPHYNVIASMFLSIIVI